MSDASLQPEPPLRRVDLMLRLAAACELILIGCTWRLWFVSTEFPRVPIAAVFLPLTSSLPIVSGVLCVCLLVCLASGWRQRRGPQTPVILATLICGGLAVCLNQHCLQAWHWLFLLTMSLRLALPGQDLIIAMRRMIPGIYLFAALSRFGPSIDSGMSRQIVQTLLDLTSLTTLAANPQTVSRLCVALSLIELIIGLLLLIPRTRRWGCPAAVAMHLILMVVLSPAGMRQQTAVLVWNASLAVGIVVLYAAPGPAQPSRSLKLSAATLFLFAWPALSLIGITDNWTGWQLYSPRPEVLQLQVHADAVSQLPPSLLPYVSDPQPLQDWCSVRLDRWSLQAKGVPLYPQARFQLAVALLATADVAEDQHLRATLDAPASPGWWKRVRTNWAGRSDLTDALSGYRLVAVPPSRTPLTAPQPSAD